MEQQRTIYGDRNHYAILESPEGWIPPPRIGNLLYLTDTSSIFAGLNHVMKQVEIAALAGVGQQAIARCAMGGTEPRLSPEAWQRVVRAFIDTAAAREVARRRFGP